MLPLDDEELPMSLSGPGLCDSGSKISASGGAVVEVLKCRGAQSCQEHLFH